MDNPSVKVVETRLGKGLVATAPIKKDEVIAEFDGEIYTAEKASDLPSDLPKKVIDHAIQCGQHQWRDSAGFARYMNHSCEPNVGYRGFYTLVAMHDIEPGEELFFDYDMSENSDWRMECLCGTPSCRGVIGSFLNLPESKKKEYNGYVSAWLRRAAPVNPEKKVA